MCLFFLVTPVCNTLEHRYFIDVTLRYAMFYSKAYTVYTNMRCSRDAKRHVEGYHLWEVETKYP